MYKLIALSAFATIVAVTPAVAQTPSEDFKPEVTMRPKTAGTPDHPRGIELKGSFPFPTNESTELPVILGVRIRLPRGIGYNGSDYPTCSKKTLDQRGPRGCPRKSIMGSARAPSPFGDASDGSAHPQIDFVNGGPRRIWAYTTIYHPMLVQFPVAMKLKKLRHSKKWAYELRAKTPDMLILVAGVPMTLSELDFAIGKKSYAPRYLVSNGGCPKRGFFTYTVDLHYRFWYADEEGSFSDRGRIACK